jgi:hypothetical protein
MIFDPLASPVASLDQPMMIALRDPPAACGNKLPRLRVFIPVAAFWMLAQNNAVKLRGGLRATFPVGGQNVGA